MTRPATRKQTILFLLGVASLTLIISSVLLANNPIAVNSGGNATRWNTGTFPISYTTDNGPLGALSEAQADTLTSQAFGAWSGVATANVTAVASGGILADGDVNTIAEFNALGCQNVNPIVYDNDGSLTDALLGAGAKNNVLGFAGPCAIQPAANPAVNPDIIVGGRATMNGFLITGAAGLAYSRSKGVFIHELGHFLGIGHSQVNLNCLTNLASCPSNTPGGDLFGVPTMFPILLNQTEDAGNTSYSETLTVDDQSAISTLYPNPNNSFTTNLGTINGQVRFSDGTNEAQGINVIARRIGDPRVTAISNVSGMFAHGNASSSAGSSDPSLRGDFAIRGLPPGTYTLEIESVNPSFIGGSRVGPLSGSTGRSENIPIPSPAVAECFGGPESNTDNPATCQNIVVAAGNELNNNNFVLNETFATLDATDAVARNENVGAAAPIGSGTFARSMSGPNGADDQDYYALSVTSGVPISIEIRSRRLTPARYMAGGIEIVSGAGGPPLQTCRLGDATGAYDQVCMNEGYIPTGGSFTRDPKLQFMPGSTGVVILSVVDTYGDARPDFLYDLIIGGVAPVPTVTFTPPAENFSLQTINTTSFPRDIQVVNNGAVSVTLNSFQKLGANPTEFSLVAPFGGTPCNLAGGTVLAAGGSCFFGLTFTPTVIGARSATIRVNHSAGDSPSDLPVTGTGSGGPPNDLRANAITTDPSPFSDFQDTTLATQSVDDITLGAGLPFFSCNVAVPPANNKSIWYKFTTPAAGNGTITATPFSGYDVAVGIATGGVFTPQACANSNGPGIPESIGLTVSAGVELFFMVAAVNGDGGPTFISFTFTPTGINADLSITKTDSNLIFTEGSTGSYAITVTNSGTTATSPAMPVTVVDILPPGFSYSSVSSAGSVWNCSPGPGVVSCSLGSNTIAGSGGISQFTLTLAVAAPAAAQSPVTNNVQVFGGGDITQGNNFASDTTNVNPAPAPIVDIAPPSKDFGSVGSGTTSATQTFTLLNSGNGVLNVASITKGGTDAAQFNLITAPTGGFTCQAGANVLAASASCTFGASFAPAGAGSARSANISVVSNASTSPNLVALSGTNVPLGTLTGNPTNFNFGSQAVGTATATQTFTLSNTGPGNLMVTALDVVGNAADDDDFMPDALTTCPVDDDPFAPFALNSGGSCIVVIAFTPTALGLREITVTFTATNSTVPSVVVTLSGTGIGGDITFTNTAGGNLWTTPGNWNLGRIPNAADTVHINGVAPNSANVTLNGGGTHTIAALDHTSAGTLTINGGASLTFTSPSTATTITVNGDGAGVGGADGHLTANGTLAVNTLSVNNGGVFEGTGNVTIANQLNFGSLGAGGMGNIGGTGLLTNNGLTFISQGALAGRTFNSNGTSNVTSLVMNDGAIFNNLPTRTIMAQTNSVGFAQGSGATSVLNNQGIFQRDAVGGNYDINGVQFNNTGTVTVTAGTLRVINGPAGQYTQTGAAAITQLTNSASGDITVTTPLQLQGGTLGGRRSVNGGVNNTGGIVRPGNSAGILTFANSYVQGANPAALNIEIGGTTPGNAVGQHDQLNVTGAPGTASLSGTLNVTLIDGFVPAIGHSFTILTSTGLRTGTFGTLNLQALPAGRAWRITYNANSVVLDVVAPAVTFAPTNVNFGNVQVGQQTATTDVQLTNSGGATLNITSIGLTGDTTQFVLLAPTAGVNCVGLASLAPAASCNIGVRFGPSTAGVKNAAISMVSDAVGSPHTVTLTGTGVVPLFNIGPPSPFNFASRLVGTTSAAQNFTVSNGGSGTTLSITNIVFGGANPGDFVFTNAGGGACTPLPKALIGPAQICTFTVAFSPTSPGAKTATVTFTSNDNNVPGSQNVLTLNGTGLAATVNLAPSPADFGNQRVGTTGAVVPVTVTNSGGADATLAGANAVTITGTNAAEFAIVGGTTCVNGFVLIAGGGSCIVNLTFSPTATGARVAVLNIANSAAGSPHSANLNGTGVLANVALAPNPLNFGNQRQGVTSAAQTITVTNSGNENSTLAAVNPVTIAGVNAADFAIVAGTTTCVANFVLNAGGGSCLIRITFTPGALGARTATVNVADDAPGSPQQSTLNGTGVLANVALAPNPLNFANQKVATTSGPQVITVTNSGTEAATLAAAGAVTLAGPNAADFAIAGGTTCVANFVIAAGGGSCIINITFTPGALGARTATVNVADDAPGSPQQSTLNGTGVLANVALAPNPVLFGSQTVAVTSAPTTVTVTNSGTLAATLAAVNAVTITGTNAADFVIAAGTTCVANFVLAAGGGSCVINVTFTPGALGARAANLNVFDDAPGSPQQAALTGTGVQSAVTLNPSPVNFGNQKVATTSAATTVTLTNTGTLAATLAAVNPVTIIGANPGDFAIVAGTTTCVANFVLAASGGSCIIDVTFTPGALGARTATLSVSDSDPNSPQQAQLNGTGVLANVTVTPNPVPFAARIVTTTSAAIPVTVTNTGTLAATLAAVNPVTITGANPGDFVIVAGTTTCVANFVLAAGGGSCVVSVTFTPGASGARAATLNVFDDAPASPQQTALTGTGQTPPTADFSTLIVPFGNQRVGTVSPAQVVTVTNNGEFPLEMVALSLIGADPTQFVLTNAGAGSCSPLPKTVLGGANCTFTVAFGPTSTGAKLANARATHNGNPTGTPGTNTDVALSGAGIQALVTVAPNQNFGNQRVGTTSGVLAMTVTNTGTDIATLSGPGNPVTLTGANPGDFAIAPAGTTCLAGTVLAAGGGNCNINFTFTPTATGARAATVNVADDAPGSPQQATLAGTGIQANVTLAPNPTSFGNVKVGTPSAAMTVTVTNSGTDTATLSANPAIGGLNAADFAQAAGTTCANGTVLAAGGGTCIINIIFTPGALGARTGTVSVSDDAPGSPQSAVLNGTGVLANLTLAPSPLSFGGVNLGSNSTMGITVTNTGTLQATITAALTITTANAADFALAAGTTCANGIVLAAGGGSCLINVTFTPGALGARGAQVNVPNDAPGNPHAVALNGTGTQPQVTLSSAAAAFGMVQVGTNVAAAPITLSNPGTGPLTINSITIIGANPGDFSRTTTCPLAPLTLPAGGNCSITPSMQPQPGSIGPRAATVSVADNAAGSPHNIALTGTGVDFAITTSAPQTVPAGGTASFALSFDTLGGDSINATTFACSGLPRQSVCVFTPPSLPAGSPDTNVTLAISTTSNTAGSGVGSTGPINSPVGRLPLGLLLLSVVGLGMLSLTVVRQTPLRSGLAAGRLCLLALLLVAGGYAAGCASDGSGFPEGASGTPPGSYPITVTATSGAVQRTTTVTLTVQ